MKLTKTQALVFSISALALIGILYGYLQARGRPVTIGDGSLKVGVVWTRYPWWKDTGGDLTVLRPVGTSLVPGDYGWSIEYDYTDEQGNDKQANLYPSSTQPLDLTVYYGDDKVHVTMDDLGLKISCEKCTFNKTVWRANHSNDKGSISRVESCQPATTACTFVPKSGEKSSIGISYQ